jgi:hypothetical protein
MHGRGCNASHRNVDLCVWLSLPRAALSVAADAILMMYQRPFVSLGSAVCLLCALLSAKLKTTNNSGIFFFVSFFLFYCFPSPIFDPIAFLGLWYYKTPGSDARNINSAMATASDKNSESKTAGASPVGSPVNLSYVPPFLRGVNPACWYPLSNGVVPALPVERNPGNPLVDIVPRHSVPAAPAPAVQVQVQAVAVAVAVAVKDTIVATTRTSKSKIASKIASTSTSKSTKDTPPQPSYHAIRNGSFFKGAVIFFEAQDLQQFLVSNPTAVHKTFQSLEEANRWIIQSSPAPPNPSSVVDLTATSTNDIGTATNQTTTKNGRGRPRKRKLPPPSSAASPVVLASTPTRLSSRTAVPQKGILPAGALAHQPAAAAAAAASKRQKSVLLFRKDLIMVEALRQVKQIFGHVDLLRLESEETNEHPSASSSDMNDSSFETTRTSQQEQQQQAGKNGTHPKTISALLKDLKTSITPLANWCHRMQTDYKKHQEGGGDLSSSPSLTDEQAKALRELGVAGVPNPPIYNRLMCQFLANVQLLREYKQTFGNADIPKDFNDMAAVVPEKQQQGRVDDDLDITKFRPLCVFPKQVQEAYRRWKRNPNRCMYTEQDFQLVQDLGIVLEPKRKPKGLSRGDARWEERFFQLQEFKKQHGDPNLASLKEYDQAALSTWLNLQRVKYAKSRKEQSAIDDKSKDRFFRLFDLGVRLKPTRDYQPWKVRAQKWREFTLKNPNVKLSHSSKDDEIVALAQWETKQRWHYSRLVRGDQQHALEPDRLAQLRE